MIIFVGFPFCCILILVFHHVHVERFSCKEGKSEKIVKRLEEQFVVKLRKGPGCKILNLIH